MARVAGVDLPPNKRAQIGLTYIYGVGKSRAQFPSDESLCTYRKFFLLMDELS